MRLRLYSNAILACSNASISSSHVNGCVVVVFVCFEARIATPHKITVQGDKYIINTCYFYINICLLLACSQSIIFNYI